MGFTLAQAKAAMLAKASGSGLKPADVGKLKLAPYTAEMLETIKGLPEYRAGFVIPYFSFNGVATKFFRVRYVEDATGFAAMTHKPMRYAQPKGSINELYLPPFTDWKAYAKSDRAVFITEGELKSACATRHGIATVGLGGVSMFSQRKHGHLILPQFKEFDWSDNRQAFIVFDSDAVHNPNILRAESMLCRELLQLGAVPRIVRLPQLGEQKTGLDDFLMDERGGVEYFKDLVEVAIPYQPSEVLHKLNEEVMFVANPNIVYNPERDLRMRPGDFVKSHYANRRMLVDTGKNLVERGAAQEWLNWERRSEVENFTYVPGGPTFTEDNMLNLWDGWPYQPVKGDVSMWHKALDHLFMDSDPKARRYFEQWVAYPMQHAGTKLKQAIIFWGGQGTGKSFIAEIIMRVYGTHNATKFNNASLSSSFNSWAEHKQFAVGEEIVVHSGEKKAIAEMLKTLITDTTIEINRKYVSPYTLPNCMNIILISNHAAALKLEEDDRRMFVHHVKAPKMPVALSTPLREWSHSSEGLSALFHYLLSLDLTGFDPNAQAMQTADRYNMISGGRSEHGAWVAELKEDPDNVLKLGKAVVGYSLFSLDDLLVLFKARHERSQITATTLGNEMAMQGFKRAYPLPIHTSVGTKRLWVVRMNDKFRNMGPTELGNFYDTERGRGTAKKPTAKKGNKY